MTSKQSTSDIEAIRSLLVRYCRTADDRDYDGWVSLFDAQAEIRRGPTVTAGHTELRSWLMEREPVLARGRHMCINHVIEVEADRASAVSDWIWIRIGGGIESLGRYCDKLVRVSDRWLLTERVIETAWPVDRG